MEREIVNETVWNDFDVNKLFVKTFDGEKEYQFAYSPESPVAKKLIEKTCSDLTKSLVSYDWLGLG